MLWFALSLTGFICVNFMVPDSPPLWENCADCNDYKVQGVHDLFSANFLFPNVKHYSPRPFTVPLFYKPFKADAYKIIAMQKWMLCLSAALFIISLLSLIHNLYAKLLFITLLFFYFTWWPIAGWVNTHVSESLSLSFMFIWLGSVVQYLRNSSWLYLTLNLLITFFFSFTRDSWPYVILVTYILMSLYFIYHKRNSKPTVLILVFALALFFFQGFTSNEGKRFKLPVFNSLAGRVSKNSQYMQWFADHGMPQSQQVLSDFSKMDIEKYENKNFLFTRYSDHTYDSLFNWIEKDGKKTYTKFLLTHPAYTLLLHESSTKLKVILYQDLNQYIGEPKGFFANAFNLFRVVAPWFSIIIGSACVFLYFRRKGRVLLLFAPLLIVFAILNTVIIYNSDALESDRHLFFITVLLNLSTVAGFVAILNFFLDRYFAKKEGKKYEALTKPALSP